MTDDPSTLASVLARVLGTSVADLVRLSGGASRETWSFRTDDGERILQRRRPGSTDLAGTVATEAALLRAAAAGGVPVPDVIASGDGDGLGAPWMVCERVEGEALPRRLLRGDGFADARGRLAPELGGALARIHALDPAPFGGVFEQADPIARLRDVLDLVSGSYPTFEAGFRWLERHPAPERPVALVHGDFRLGNLLVRPDDTIGPTSPALAAVLDWELAHLGNPVEDLGWCCVRAWRFGEPARVGGVGTSEQLLDGYAAAGGGVVDPAELDWWELYGTLRWGVICAVQAESHLGGTVRSVELATIGRRACENEYDALALMGVVVPLPPPDPGDPGDGGLHGRPTVAELVDAVRGFLADDVVPSTDGRLRFHARVAANALAMVERELAAGPAPVAAHAARLTRLGVADDTELAAAVRAGAFDDRWDELLAELAAATVDRLAVANPGYA